MSLAEAEKLIQDTVELPTLPQVVAKINALVDDPDVGIREIGAAVGEDAPIAAKVLKIANSAYFGLREKVVSTEHATAVLGIRMLRTIALQASVIGQYDHLRDQGDYDFEALWKHSILTGQTCAAIAARCRARIGLAPEEFHVVGLLHDIGKVLLMEARGKDFSDIVRLARANDLPEHVVEEQRLGFHHGHVGALISQQWGLPSLVGDAIQFHHGPREELLSEPTRALVALVNLGVHAIEAGDATEASAAFDERARALLGVHAEDVADVIDQAQVWHTQIRV